MQQLSVTARHGAVVSIDKYASRIGVDVLQQGGNAVDAAIATAFALAVTHPFAGNLGGGGFMLIRPAKGEAVAIDFRETAPAQATPRMFLQADGTVDEVKSNFGYQVAAVPGTVKGLATAWQHYGTLPWSALLAPAIALAQDGIYLNPYDAASLVRYQKDLARFPETVKTYFKPAGQPYGPRDLLRQPFLAETLRVLAREGAAAFYTGSIAGQLVTDVQANGGLIQRSDLENYTAKIRQPITGNFGGYEIIGMPLPSSGGIMVQAMLNVVSNLNLKAGVPLAPDNVHLLTETMRYAFLDRTTYLGDADFVDVPVTRLLAPEYAAGIVRKINPLSATPSANLSPDVQVHPENMETTHFSLIDKQGTMVSVTVTLEEAFGSKAVVKDLGFLLNCEMHDFNINPQQANLQGLAAANPNGIAPGKRMLSSMSPTLVLKDNKPFLITGSPGGRTILNTVLQIILGTTYYQLPLRQVLDLPRFSHHWLPDTLYLEKSKWPARTRQALRAKGHKLTQVDSLGDAHSILIDPATGWYHAEADARRAGWAAGF